MAEPAASGIHVGQELRAPDTPLLGPEGEKAQQIAELAAGMRCVGCGERIRIGLRFTQFKPVLRGGRTTVDTVVTQACSRDECKYAGEVAPVANAMEMIEFAWLDDGGKASAAPDRADARKVKSAGRDPRARQKARAAAAR